MIQEPTVPEDNLRAPTTDDAQLTAILGAKGYSDDVSLSQFAAWGDSVGLFELLATRRATTLDEVVTGTPLTGAGADALLGVLASLKLVSRGPDGFTLSDLAREYLVPHSPYYVGRSLFLSCREPLPTTFVRREVGRTARPGRLIASLSRRLLKRMRGWEFGGRRILENQHSRNLPAAVAAANSALFAESECVVDMAGGSGTFAIPFAQHHPDKRIILTDLPESLLGIRRFLKRYGVDDRIELVGMDVFADSWPIPECDAMFFGNFIHGFADDRCTALLRHGYAKLRRGGKILLHEMVWNENKNGPLKTALWNVTMRDFGGKQRTVSELQTLLRDTGYAEPFVQSTSGGFVIVGAVKPGVVP